MDSISASNLNSASNLSAGLGLGGSFGAAAVADSNRFAFGAIDIAGLASAIIDAIKSGTLPEGLGELLSKLLSPVEMGQLLAALEKLLRGEGGAAPQGAAPSTGGGGGRAPSATSPTAPAAAAPSAPSPAAPAATPAAGTDTRITTRAPDSANIPALETIANNPTVAAAIEKAWVASNPNGPGAKQEQGFWVLRDNKTGAYSIVNFPSNGTRDSLTPGAVPKVEGKSVAAFFHTHPNTVAEGYRNGPSPADQNFADARGIPGIIQSHNGLYFFNPTK